VYDLEDITEEKQEFSITDDLKAEWAVKIIKQEEKENERLLKVIDEEIRILNEKKKKLSDALENKIGFLKFKLSEYFETVEKKELKTCFKYKLPSADLVFVKPTVKYERDDEKILDWLANNGKSDYIKHTLSVDWAELKKTDFINQVDGITEVQVPAKFEVK
jgi:uncharacterized protein with gpF-like domain